MLINCKECGKEISDQARTSPNCGAKIRKEKQNNTPTIAIICIIMMGILFISCSIFLLNGNNYYKYRKEAVNILESYKDMDISREIAQDKIDRLSDEVSDILETEDDVKLFGLKVTLNSISWNLVKGELSNTKVNEYINELKK